MSKQRDIPQDVWDAAADVLCSIDGCSCEVCISKVARAIMAERNRAAKVASEYIFTDLAKYHSNQAVAGNATMNVAAMILGTLPVVVRENTP